MTEDQCHGIVLQRCILNVLLTSIMNNLLGFPFLCLACMGTPDMKVDIHYSQFTVSYLIVPPFKGLANIEVIIHIGPK